MQVLDTLILVDGSGYVYRAFHAIRDLRRSDGTPTNAAYGFLQMLRVILESQTPEHIAVVFDPPGDTFRSDLFAAYKKQREAAPEGLRHQWDYIFRLLDALGVPRTQVDRFEADDVIGSLARWAAGQGLRVVIYSGDKDLLQLVDDRTSVISQHGRNERHYTPSEVRERYGVNPPQLVDVLALMGDTSDNIPGVPGIGEKGASQLIAEYGSLEAVLEHAAEVKNKRPREGLERHADQARLSKQLATIRTDAPVERDLARFRRKPVQAEELAALLTELEFHQSLQDFGVAAAAPERAPCGSYRVVATLEELHSLAGELAGRKRFAVDTETTGTDALRCELVGISLAWREGEAVYLPLGHQEGGNLGLANVKEHLGPILASDAVKVGHNVKFDIESLAGAGLELSGPVADTMVASYLLHGSEAAKKLDALAESQLSMRMTPITALIGKDAGAETMAEVPVERVAEYAGEDADATWRLDVLLRPRLAQAGLERLFEDVEMPLVLVLTEMERIGVRVAPDVLREQSKELATLIDERERAIHRLAGGPFNVNSPKQLAEVLFDRMGAKAGRNRSTRADVLERLAAGGHELAAEVLEYRRLAKIKSTYLDALQDLIHPRDGRVHTSYNQTVTATGRLSSSDPNLQNIPIRTDVGRRVREAFVAEDGWRLISADYSQIEIRVMADLTGDPSFKRAFEEGADIHRRTAGEVFDVAEADVTPDLRTRAKAINFGLLYGITEHGLAGRLGISAAEAAAYIERYFRRYPNVRDWQEETVRFAREQGYVLTRLGRRVPTPRIHSENRMEREAAERAAINAPVQGTAADMLKVGMVRLHQRLADRRARMILTVHDEVIVEAPEDEVEAVLPVIRETMEGALPLSVPVEVDTAVGRTWAEL